MPFVIPVFLICFLLICHCFARKRVVYLWTSSFVIWWGSLLCISLLNPFDLYEVSDEAYFLFLIHIFFYVIGFMSAPSARAAELDAFVFRVCDDSSRIYKSKIFAAILLVNVAALTLYAYRYVSVISEGGASDARKARFEIGMGTFSSSYEIILYEYVLGGLIWFLKFLVAYGICCSKWRNPVWALSFVSCCLYMLIGGGRLFAIEIGLLIIFIIGAIFCLGVKNDLVKTSYFRTGFFVFLLYLASVFGTFVRTFSEKISMDGMFAANDILIEHAVIYFQGSLRAFDFAIHNYTGLFHYSYGRMTGGGVDEILTFALRWVGFDVLPYSSFWGVILADPISIGDGQYFNALYTALFNFYFDLGAVGVVIFSYVFGWFCSAITSKFAVSGGLGSLFVLSLLYSVSMLGVLTWKLTQGPIVFTLFSAFVIDHYLQGRPRR